MRVNEKNYGSQKQSETSEDKEKKFEQTIKILLGILKVIDSERLEKYDLPMSSERK